MIKLHLNEQDEFGAKIRQELQDLRLAFEIKLYPASSEHKLPMIEESGIGYKSKTEIEGWLTELKAELKHQRSISGDGCYIDPETGEYC